MGELEAQIASARTALADHDQSDYVGLGAAMERIGGIESELRLLEIRWYELSEFVE